MQQLALSLISHEIENYSISPPSIGWLHQRNRDVQRGGKNFGGYQRKAGTKDFLAELATSMQIRIDDLIYTYTSVKNEERGTWVHPDVAVHLAQWCAPKFAVAVAREWLSGKSQTAKLPNHLER